MAAWLLLLAAEAVHGILRRLFVVPLIGPQAAHAVGVLVGSIIIFAIAWLCIRWIGAASISEQLKVGVLWVTLMAVFEFGLGAALGYSWERMLAEYNLAAGGYMGLGLAFLLFAPALAAKARGVTGGTPPGGVLTR